LDRVLFGLALYIARVAGIALCSPSVVQSMGRGAAELPLRPVARLLVVCKRFKHLRKPCLVALLAASRTSGVIMNRGMLTAYLPFLISSFDRIGLSMRPAVTQLKVARLYASYTVDTKH
jgi:hypothetical protein